MKAAPFEYARAASLSEVCALLATHGDGAKLLAGGQSLVPMMAMRLVRPAWLIDINEIAALKFVSVENDAVRTGACTRQCVVERDEALAAKMPLLAQALSSHRLDGAGVLAPLDASQLRRAWETLRARYPGVLGERPPRGGKP